MTLKQNPSYLSLKLHRLGHFRKFLLLFTLTTATFELYTAPLCNAVPSLAPRQPITPSTSVMNNTAVTFSSSSQLQAIVECAVNDSISALGDNIILNVNNTLEFVNTIVRSLLDAGVTAPLRCKPKPGHALKQQFLSSLQFNDADVTLGGKACLRLDEVPELGESGYILTTSSSCKNDLEINLTCFGTRNQQNQCYMETKFQSFSENYFPRYLSHMICRGCNAHDIECLEEHGLCYTLEKQETFHLLKRLEGQCDENGFEQWQIDATTKHTAVVACDCIRTT